MKKNIIRIIAISLLFMLSLHSFTSCESTKVNDPNFIADMDPVELGEVVCLTKQTFGKPKARNLVIYFNPVDSSYNTQFKELGVNVYLEFSPKETANLSSGIESYLSMNENKSFDKNHKAKMSNKFQSGNIKIKWGTIGLGYKGVAYYDTNYEYIEENPYFRLCLHSIAYSEDEDIKSPDVNMYFTPNQLEELKRITEMSFVMSKIEEIENAAYGFDQ